MTAAEERIRAEVSLPQESTAARDGRQFVRGICLRLDLTDDICNTVVLLTSELVTNAFLYGRSDPRLLVSVSTDTIWVGVSDDNSRHPRRSVPDTGALDGRGLAMLDVLSDSWGTRDEPVGKTVWFSLLR